MSTTTKTRYFVATTPDGVKVGRQSRTREYRWASCGRRFELDGVPYGTGGDSWEVLGFSTTEESARRTAAGESYKRRRVWAGEPAMRGYRDVCVVPVQEYTGECFRQERENGEVQ